MLSKSIYNLKAKKNQVITKKFPCNEASGQSLQKQIEFKSKQRYWCTKEQDGQLHLSTPKGVSEDTPMVESFEKVKYQGNPCYAL